MKTFARILLIFCGVILLAHYLPAGYWLMAAKMRHTPTVFYSCTQKEFLFYRYTNQAPMVRMDSHGKTYEREEFEQLLPLDNWIQLLRDGKLPESVDGVALSTEALKHEKVYIHFKPEEIDPLLVNLTPLLEAESGRVRLETPEDFMRLGTSIAFINAQSNVVEQEKSALFQRAFKEAGFVFPVSVLGGNPSTMKPYDEGYYAADATGATFHLRQVKGQPEIRRVADLASGEDKAKWQALKPRYFAVQEQPNQEIHATIIDKTNQAWLVVGEKYRLVRIPLKRYDPSKMNFMVRGDLLNRLISVAGDNYVEAVVLNRNYDFVDRYTEELPRREAMVSGKIARAIFPFTVEFEDVSSSYFGWFPELGSGVALVVNGLLLAGLVVWLVARKQLKAQRVPDLLAVAVGGIYGWVLFLLLPKGE